MLIRVLFVENDLTTADLLVPSLERKGYQVTVERTQRQATSRIRTTRPDVLIVEDPALPRYLRTVRGVGYRLDVPASSPDSTPRNSVP